MTTMSKRDRLVESAKTLFYQQGVTRSTIADIAQQAQVPLGNVYYHFHTKDALIEAVIQAHVQELETTFASWQHQYTEPRERLLALLVMGRNEENMLARYGCPHGSLCQELDKDENELTRIASRLFEMYLNWTEAQFSQLGKEEQEANDLAVDLISSLQGIYVLSNSFRSPELLERKLQRLETWVRAL